jgi:hypothetical protein
MPDYLFNRCPENSLEKIASLCLTIGLKEVECYASERQWCRVPKDPNSKIQLVAYSPDPKVSLLIQTNPNTDYNDPDVKDFMTKLLEYSNSKKIYDVATNPRKPLNMSLFVLALHA